MMSQSNEKKPYYKRLWFKMLIATLIWFALIAGKGGPEDAGALIMILPLAWIILYLIDSQPARDQNAQTRQARYEQKLKEIDMNRSITPVDGKTYCKVNHGLPVSPKEKVELEIGEDALLIKTKANTYKISFKKLRIVTALKETELVKKVT